MRVLAVLALSSVTALAGMSAFAGDRVASLGDHAKIAPESYRAESVHVKGDADRDRDPALSSWEKQQIATLVRRQMAAVASGDAKTAYEVLSPDTQSFYAHPEAFLFAIGQQTRPITDVRSYHMAGIEQDPFRNLQHVYLTDSQGREWLARFQVVRHGEGWRVRRCFVEAVEGGRA
jgi:hypothetical protein